MSDRTATIACWVLFAVSSAWFTVPLTLFIVEAWSDWRAERYRKARARELTEKLTGESERRRARFKARLLLALMPFILPIVEWIDGSTNKEK